MNMRAKLSIKPPKWLERLRIQRSEGPYSERKDLSIIESLATRLLMRWRLKRRGRHGRH